MHTYCVCSQFRRLVPSPCQHCSASGPSSGIWPLRLYRQDCAGHISRLSPSIVSEARASHLRPSHVAIQGRPPDVRADLGPRLLATCALIRALLIVDGRRRCLAPSSASGKVEMETDEDTKQPTRLQESGNVQFSSLSEVQQPVGVGMNERGRDRLCPEAPSTRQLELTPLCSWRKSDGRIDRIANAAMCTIGPGHRHPEFSREMSLQSLQALAWTDAQKA